jgi:DNA-directed RNA polymerase III subunit RPC2
MCVLKKYANRTEDRIVVPSSPGAGSSALASAVASAHVGSQQHRDRRGVLDADGMVAVGQLVHPGDVFVDKQTPVNTRDGAGDGGGATAQHVSGAQLGGAASSGLGMYRPTPAIYRGEPAVVDRVLLTLSDEGQFVVKAMARSTRRPEVGDKFSSRHGQKGVLGAVVPQPDMPFALASGLTPDLIMNPHGFPSRMTVGKLVELVGAKAAVTGLGRHAYGTAFADGHGGHGDDAATLSACLVASGLSYDGREALCCGQSGAMLAAYVFTGPVYYQKLKHMVSDKMHARARGPRLVLTRQPTEGRSRDGGLRLGEMERDCLIAYGSAGLLHERLCLSSDVTDVHVCAGCGLLGYFHHGVRARICAQCNAATELGSEAATRRSAAGVITVRLPYAAKLLFQELQAMNVCPRLQLDG